MEEKHQEHAKIFKAFCDPKRLAILEQLRSGEKYHMKILCDSGIVDSRQEGKWSHYRLSIAGRDKALELLKMLATPDFGQSESCEDTN